MAKIVVAVGVSMVKGGDIIALGQSLKSTMDKAQSGLPVGVSLSQIQDQPKAVSRSVSEFVSVLIEAVVIVLVVSFVSLGWHKGGRFGWHIDMRPGLVVAITIPLVLAIAQPQSLLQLAWQLAATARAVRTTLSG